MRYFLALLLPLLAACADMGGRATPAPTGISAVHTNGDTRGGGADPIYMGRGSYGTMGFGSSGR